MAKMTKFTSNSIVILILTAVFLTGCYLPGSFDAEIELSRTGLYKMKFDGYIVDLKMYDDLRTGKLSKQSEINPKIDQVIGDFKRDSGTRAVSYFGNGAFKVVWGKSGDLIRTTMISFFRRNENMLSISYVKDKGLITLAGKSIGKNNAARLNKMGLNIRGVLRIKTDTRVISHNAQKVIKNGQVAEYVWEVLSIFDKAPKMVVSFQ